MSKQDLNISEMKKMQFDLYEKNKEKWNDMNPKATKSHILYMIEEFSKAYIEKHNVNMNRNYIKDNEGKYNKKTF